MPSLLFLTFKFVIDVLFEEAFAATLTLRLDPVEEVFFLPPIQLIHIYSIINSLGFYLLFGLFDELFMHLLDPWLMLGYKYLVNDIGAGSNGCERLGVCPKSLIFTFLSKVKNWVLLI